MKRNLDIIISGLCSLLLCPMMIMGIYLFKSADWQWTSPLLWCGAGMIAGIVVLLPFFLHWTFKPFLTVDPLFAWYDLWVGIYIDTDRRKIYVLPLPCIGFVINYRRRRLLYSDRPIGLSNYRIFELGSPLEEELSDQPVNDFSEKIITMVQIGPPDYPGVDDESWDPDEHYIHRTIAEPNKPTRVEFVVHSDPDRVVCQVEFRNVHDAIKALQEWMPVAGEEAP